MLVMLAAPPSSTHLEKHPQKVDTEEQADRHQATYPPPWGITGHFCTTPWRFLDGDPAKRSLWMRDFFFSLTCKTFPSAHSILLSLFLFILWGILKPIIGSQGCPRNVSRRNVQFSGFQTLAEGEGFILNVSRLHINVYKITSLQYHSGTVFFSSSFHSVSFSFSPASCWS